MSEERTESEATAFLEYLREGVGVSSGERITRDDVNQPMIRHWCDVMTDHNPVYTDPEFAEKIVHGGIVRDPEFGRHAAGRGRFEILAVDPRVDEGAEVGRRNVRVG